MQGIVVRAEYHEKVEEYMDKNRFHEIGKSRLEQIKLTYVCNRTVTSIFVLWIVWVSASLLIYFMR